ncbi:MAG TPA: transporter substrate-binding domain-containing protein [Arenimonas sp.]|nr:transporter substrate-binding domain-containing protein [Arenimonas sp.]
MPAASRGYDGRGATHGRFHDGVRMHGCLFLWLGLLLAIPASARASAQLPLRVAVSQANGEPFVLYDSDGRFRGGIAKDIIDQFARALAIKPQYLDLPRARVVPELLRGGIDAACFLAPAWVERPGRLQWSPSLFHIRQVIVSPASASPVRRADDLFGKRVGTLLNYTYPELQPFFADGRIQRADAPSEASNLAKLQRGRIEALLAIDLTILHQQTHGQLQQSLRIDALWGDANPVHCAFSQAFVTRLPGWRKPLEEMVANGQVQTWIDRYTGGRRIPAAQGLGVDCGNCAPPPAGRTD